MSSIPPSRSDRMPIATTTEDSRMSLYRTKSQTEAERRVGLASPGRPWKRAKLSATVESATEVVPAQDRGGELERFIELPLDVQLEICSHLGLRDLLKMCRLTKELRRILMRKSSISTWRNARKGTAGLPPIFEGLSEPQYADLLFDNRCHHCLTPTFYIQWAIRMRLCRDCLFKTTTMFTENELRGQNLGDRTKVRKLLAVTPRYDLPNGMADLPFYHRHTFERLLQESAPLPRGAPQYTVWLSQKQEEHAVLVQSYKPHENWWKYKMPRPAELATYRRLRYDSIMVRLKADGWTEELKLPQTIDALHGHPLILQPRKLTDQDWAALKPALTGILSNVRADQLKRTMRRVISERTSVLEKLGSSFFATLPEMPHNPPASALCVYQPFLDIINSTPPEEDATAALSKGLETVPAICEAWRREQESRLKTLLRKLGRSDDLSLAVNAFTCATHHKLSESPCIFHHPHFGDHHCFYSPASVGYDINVRVWNGKAVRAMDRNGYEHCGEFVRMCGLHPATATVEDMDGADVFFRCGVCDSRRKSVKEGRKEFGLMRWRTAINHRHVGRVCRVEDAELVALGRRNERRLLEKDLEVYDSQAFVCVHCDVPVYSRSGRAGHLRAVHGIDGEFNNVDHYRRSLKDLSLSRVMVEVWQAIPKA